jgi:hypothetical protein
MIAHIRNRGDVPFGDDTWAGRLGRGHSIEAFWVEPQEMLAPGDIEYKGLTATGFETPWLTDSAICGTRGMATPLLGFAIRLTAKPRAKTYDCEYTGYFQSGKTAGPFRNGAPCKSSLSNDPLEGIRLVIRERASGQTAPGDRAETVPVKRQQKHGPVADSRKTPSKDAGRKIGASKTKLPIKSGGGVGEGKSVKAQTAGRNPGKNSPKLQKGSTSAKPRVEPQKVRR